MKHMVSVKDGLPKGNPDDLASGSEDKSLVRTRTCLRGAIEESGWKAGAVAEAIGLKGESGATYLSKMLAGEKPITARHIEALPDDIEAIYARLYAESFAMTVVEPLNHEEALAYLAKGLFSMLAHRLPAKAARMARVEIDPLADRKTA